MIQINTPSMQQPKIELPKDEFIKENVAKAIRKAYSLLHNLADAEDVAQEYAIKLIKNYSIYMALVNEMQRQAWLYVVLDNVLKDFFRKNEKYKKNVKLVDDLNQHSDFLGHYSESFEHRTLEKELLNSIYMYVKTQPTCQQEAFNDFIADLSRKQSGYNRNKLANTITKNLSKSLSAIRKKFPNGRQA